MTREQCNTNDKELYLDTHMIEEDLAMVPDKTRVKDMILRFEKTAINTTSDCDDYVERREKTVFGNFTNLYIDHVSHNRYSSVSANSIMSGLSEGSIDSYSSGFVSDRKSGTENARPLTPHRPAPPPPEPYNDEPSTKSRSLVPIDFTQLQGKRYSLPSPNRSPLVVRRAREPPCMRRKSLISNHNHQGETLWSYGVKQSDLEDLLRLKRSNSSDNEEDNKTITIAERSDNNSEETTCSDDADDDDNNSNNDDIKGDVASIDQSTDTLKNDENQNSDADEIYIDSEYSGEPSNYDNVSLKSISSFDNMVPYPQYDSLTMSSDEFGSEICHAPDSEYLTVSAVNEWCISKSIEPVTIPVESKKDKYRRQLIERVKELTNTETVYVERLRHVVKHYLSKMGSEDVPANMQGLKPEIFANIEKIHRFHSEEFLPALRDCENDLRKLGQCFRRFEDRFNMYVMYSRNNKRATRLVFEHKPFFQAIQQELGDRLDLSSYLLEPVQRIPRYKLFLTDLVKTYVNYENEKSDADSRTSELSDNSSDTGGSNGESSDSDETTLESLKQAKVMVECVLTAIDSIMALENIKQSPINLLQQGSLLRQNEFTVVDKVKKRREHMRIFLFEKVVLLTAVFRKMTVEMFLYRDHIPVDNLGITAKEHDKHKFTIWYKTRNLKSYKLETRDTTARKAWIEEISSLLWEQANKTKELLQRNRSARVSMISMNSDNSLDLEDNPGKCGPSGFVYVTLHP